MTLYLKAAEDGTSVGDCPFAHYVRMVLEEKGLEYEVRPCTAESKPQWLVELFDGKMPALRHRKECYTESEVIAQYLDFFFSETVSLSSPKKGDIKATNEIVGGLFPAIAKYLKHTPDGDEADGELKSALYDALEQIETHLKSDTRKGPFLVGDGNNITLVDCNVTPKLYHMKVGIASFKDGAIDVESNFPAIHTYMETMFNRDSFKKTSYPEEEIVWGWKNARNPQI